MQTEKKFNLFHHTSLAILNMNINLVKKLVFNGFKKCTSYNYLNRYVVHVHNNHMIAKSKLCMILRIFFDHFLLHTLLQSNTPYSNMLPTHRHATRHIVRYFGRSTRFGAKKYKYDS